MWISKEIRKKAELLLKEKKVIKEIETEKRIHFKVFGEKDIHSVIFDKSKNKFECDCQYFSLKKEFCSHILACKLQMGKSKE